MFFHIVLVKLSLARPNYAVFVAIKCRVSHRMLLERHVACYPDNALVGGDAGARGVGAGRNKDMGLPSLFNCLAAHPTRLY